MWSAPLKESRRWVSWGYGQAPKSSGVKCPREASKGSMARTRREGVLNGLAEASDMVYQPDLWGAGLKTLAMLCIVLAILIFVIFLLKRFSYLKQGSGHRQLIRVLSSYHMTPKERIALIDVAGQKMVIGITPGNITCLAQINKSEALERIEGAKPLGENGGLFGKLLMSSLKIKGRSSAG